MAKKVKSDEELIFKRTQHLLDKALMVFSIEEMDGAGRQPGSKAEVEEVKELMKEARALNPTNERQLEDIAEFEFICKEAYERRFVGFKWLMYIVAAYALFWAWNGFSNLKDKSHYTVEFVTPLYQSDIESSNAYIADYDSIPNLSRDNKKRLKQRKEHLEEILDMDMEEYVKHFKKNANRRALGSFKTSAWWILMIFLYYKSTLSPVFLINKRQRQLHIIMEGAGWLKKIIFFVVGLFIALPVVDEYKIVRRNTGQVIGHTSEISPMLFIKLVGLMIIGLFVLMMAIIAMPILTVVGYLRNYQYEKVDEFFDKVLQFFKKIVKRKE